MMIRTSFSIPTYWMPLHFLLRIICIVVYSRTPALPKKERTRMAIIINIWALCMQTALFALIYTVFSSRANRVPCTKFIGSMSHISHPSPSTMPRMLLHVIEMCLAKSIIWFSGIIIIVIIPGMYIFGVWIFRFWTCPMNVIKAHSLYFSASYILAHMRVKKMNNLFIALAISRHRRILFY